ncbi:MAG TPA: decarboxylating 6-phosphogluconate dehydrogenase [Nitrososphaerales archaeon]|nr:decarboxylating 6-phosphogluconate dehydrogenase [Nitrososphaerales archaeon]
MQIGLIGLGRMGANMARRLARDGHLVVVYNRTTSKATELATEEKGVTAALTVKELVSKLNPPRAVWVMVPAGRATGDMVEELTRLLSKGDAIIDGGNSHYTETLRRGKEVSRKGFHYVDVGTSGGVWGLKEGYSMMVGGDEKVVQRLRPVFESLAPGKSKGWGRVGTTGAGHYVKMVHNGIEYGMMEAYAEGFEVLRAKREQFGLDLYQVAEIWRFGSVIRSWLLDLTADALSKDPDLKGIAGYVEDSGEGRWTALEAIDVGVAAPIIATSLFMRFVSRQDERYADKLLASMRQEFGGHAVKTEGPTKTKLK